MPTDLNTLDWWNEGFDDFFAGRGWPHDMTSPPPELVRGAVPYLEGWLDARAYRNALKEQTDDEKLR